MNPRNIPRADAVATLAGILTDSAHWVVGISPHQVGKAARILAGLGGTFYFDRGGEKILEIPAERAPAVATAAGFLELLGGSIQIVAVAAIPKSAGAARVAAAFGRPGYPLPADGTMDVIVYDCDCGPRYAAAWPELLVDAIATTDPRRAARLRANSLANLN